MQGDLEGIYMRAYTSYHVQTKPKRKKKVAGKREVRIIAYTSKHKKQRATPSRIEEETLIRPFHENVSQKYDIILIQEP